VIIPPTEPGRDFADFKAAVRAAREAIAAGDADALAEAIQSVEPAARVELASSLRGELLTTGTSPDDPLIAVFDEQIAAAGGDPAGDDAVADDEAVTEDDPEADVVEEQLPDGISVDPPDGQAGDSAEAAPVAGDLDVVAAAEKLAELVRNGDDSSAASLLQDLTPEQRAAVIEQVGEFDETQADPAAAGIIAGIDPTATDQAAALEQGKADLRATIDAQRAAADEAAEPETGENASKVPDGANTPPPVPAVPSVTDGTSNTIVIGEEPPSEGATGDASGDSDFGAGAVTSPTPGGGAAPAIPPTPLTDPSTPSAPGTPDTGAEADAGEAEPDFGRVGGDDFFGGEASSGEVIPIDPPDEADEDVLDQTVGGDDFFSVTVPEPTPTKDDGLTPEQLAELAAIDAEAASAIIDNFDA
jgi:hypothetical protein